ncbi:histidine kinase [Panaeolus papilionaceus]|nr:histidine kinase [Panaeolus papilionaceus]
MKKKFGQASFPTLYFRDGILFIPGYTFEKAFPWKDTGSMTILAEGNSLKDGSSVLAKIAPAQSNGSMCLEREAHILKQVSSSPYTPNTTLRVIEFYKIPRESGDCVVLLLIHPGLNLLGHYLPSSKVNDLLLPDVSRTRSSTGYGDGFTMNADESPLTDEMEAFDIMDLASFLEFAIQATHCLEALHKVGIVHREVRANAFHLNSHSGYVRLVHFGNRAISLENYGSPSSLVLRAYGEAEKLKIKEALCYLAPEQTGSIETMTQDHRTDLYSLGILFWTLLVGRGQMPFEGGALELLHSIVQKRPMPVHEVRRDVPQVLANIIDKLLSKNPDLRYQSAYGLKTDLMECQRRLLATVSAASDESSELISPFEIALEDRFMEFTIPIALFGRDKELELIRSVIRNVSTSFSRHFMSSKSYILLPNGSSQDSNADRLSDTESTMDSPHPTDSSPTMHTLSELSSYPPSGSASMSPSMTSNSKFRKVMVGPRSRINRTQTLLVVGPPGIGKSSLILVNQAKWRSHGLWGQAKFQNADSAPFAALLGCLSSVLRQLMVFHTDLNRFVMALQERLGPQIQNVPLLYQGTPELKDVLALFNIHITTPQEPLNTKELRARFQSLVENVFIVIAEIRLFALFLDDLHEADTSTLDLVSTLVNSRSRMLIFATLRSDKTGVVERIRSMFSSRSRPTWIAMDPLPLSAISSLVSKTLHRSKEDCEPLSQFVYGASTGNAFSARSILTTLQRQHYISFSWEHNHWTFDMEAIHRGFSNQKIADPTELSFLIDQLRELPEDARKYLLWAAFFGETFKVTEIALMMEWEDASGSTSEDEVEDMWGMHKAASNLRDVGSTNSHRSMRGLQVALAEGWLITRARDMCSFAHDRYRQAAQAEVENLTDESISKMSFRIVLMMLHENPKDVYRIAEHAQSRCLSLFHDHPRRDELLDVLIDAGESAWARGAHELAIQSFVSARNLLREKAWADRPSRTFNLLSHLAALLTWKGDLEASDVIVRECLLHTKQPEDKGNLLRLRSRNHWLKGNYPDALEDTLLALKVLGVELDPAPTRRQADAMFEEVRNEILAVGFDEILSIPRTTDPRTELAVALLNDAGINAYWSPSPTSFADIVGLTTIKLALRSGMAPGTALGFFWALGVAAEKRELHRFSADLAKLALQIAERHGSSGEKCRAQVLFCAMVSGFDNVHIRANLPRLELAIKLGNSAGDRVYTSFAKIHTIITKLYIGEHLNELLSAAEECISDVKVLAPNGEPIILATAVLNCIRVLGGHTSAESAESLFDSETFDETRYLKKIHETSGNIALALNWCVVSYYSIGYIQEAATLGFSVYQTRDSHPNHRHIRYALFFHSLALVACLRRGLVSGDQHRNYLAQINSNQAYIRKWLSPSPVNCSMWIALVDAEVSALLGTPNAFKLYDSAVKLAVNNDWVPEEAWALYLQGSHFIRCGVEGLGSELQRRGIARHSHWGAQGVVQHLTLSSGMRVRLPLKRAIFSSDAAVQTDNIANSFSSSNIASDARHHDQVDQESSLSASDLASILKWSQEISSDIILSSALQRLTEIATGASGSRNTCVVIAREAGDYAVATSMLPPQPCQVHENPKPIRNIADPLQKAIIQHTLNSKEQVYYDDASLDPRFSSEAGQSQYRSVICLPIFSNRGQTFGTVYLASRQPFTRNTLTILTLLCQQASISISNALLFRSVQAGTRENLKMIASQKEALEAADKSREDALKATKIKSNFLASMSHELRTPFSSFYGLLDLLSGTELNAGQSEIVQTAKQSCELLLKIIDSILDYSKLEASAVKLEPSGFLVENIIADCMELLLPMAVKKLDLSFNIEADVPPWVYADYARIRQVLMNLIGNAVKFTAAGSVRVICSVDTNITLPINEAQLKFEIHDTGIGLSPSDVELLFVPFQQADNSSTRRFGGTGLGLSISRQLVKLMGGAIGVTSVPDKGSMFWFTLPVKLIDTEESQKYDQDVHKLWSLLTRPRPLHILVCSASDATLSLLKTMLSPFHVQLMPTVDAVHAYLKSYGESEPLDFIILDHQSDALADDLAHYLHGLSDQQFSETKILHMYTPTTSTSGSGIFPTSSIPGVIKMTKPPRQVRLLHTLAELKNLPHTVSTYHTSEVNKAIQDIINAQRRLQGNVLIAEDNPIAQNLLIKQLERHHLHVVATSNGEEAIAAWEAHEPGYFSVALFDHHMPICDGVEAAKRLRVLENKRKAPAILPIIALSADCQESTKQLCLSAGMNAFFTKPLKKGDLMQLLSMFGSPIAGAA